MFQKDKEEYYYIIHGKCVYYYRTYILGAFFKYMSCSIVVWSMFWRYILYKQRSVFSCWM